MFIQGCLSYLKPPKELLWEQIFTDVVLIRQKREVLKGVDNIYNWEIISHWAFAILEVQKNNHTCSLFSVGRDDKMIWD